MATDAQIEESAATGTDHILVTGGTGYIGGKLIPRLERAGALLRCMARNPVKLRRIAAPSTEVVEGDLLDIDSLDRDTRGVTTAYYLVHSMGSADDFQEVDRRAAENFGIAARANGVRRIIYLGGLGDDREDLSPHLKSRHEVGEVLRQSGVEVIELRTSIVIGAGSASFEMVRTLTNRLPVMLCPKWLTTKTQPIAIDDILAYLLAARDLPRGPSRIIEVGGSDVVSYSEIIREYARQKGMRRVLIFVPVLTPWLSGLWLRLVTPSKAEVGRHLIEGLRNPTIVRDESALQLFPITPLSVPEAIARALRESS